MGLFNRALTLSPTTIKLLAIGLACYAAIEVVEGVGLWVGKRWGEYFAMVATSVGLPFEIYDLVNKVSTIGLILFAINLFLVLYLVITKRRGWRTTSAKCTWAAARSSGCTRSMTGVPCRLSGRRPQTRSASRADVRHLPTSAFRMIVTSEAFCTSERKRSSLACRLA